MGKVDNSGEVKSSFSFSQSLASLKKSVTNAGHTFVSNLRDNFKSLSTAQKVAVVAVSLFASVTSLVGGILVFSHLAKVLSQRKDANQPTSEKPLEKGAEKTERTSKILQEELESPFGKKEDPMETLKLSQKTFVDPKRSSQPTSSLPESITSTKKPVDEEFKNKINSLTSSNIKDYVNDKFKGFNISGLTDTVINDYKLLAKDHPTVYASHIVLLAKENPQLAATVLCQTGKLNNVGHIAQQLATELSPKQMGEMIKVAVRQHIALENDEPDSLLRGNTFTSKLIGAFAEKYLKGDIQNFIKEVVGGIPKTLIEDKTTVNNEKLNPLGVRSLEVAGNSLLFKLDGFLKNESNNGNVKIFKEICLDTKDAIENSRKYKGQGLEERVAGDHLILRVLNPMFMPTELKKLGIEDKNQSQNCMLLGKMMQNLNSGAVPGKKEKHHHVLEGWHNKNLSMMTSIRQRLFGV